MAELTASQLQELAQNVKNLLAAESQGVGEIPLVTSLDMVVSLPALKRDGVSESVVEAPLTLLRVFLRKSESGIEWRQGDSAAWQPLVSMDEIRGKSAEFRSSEQGIEWRYAGTEEPWKLLVSLDQLKFKFDDLNPDQIDQIRGFSAFDLWQKEPGNEQKSYEDYKAWQKEEALAAATAANTAAGEAAESASAANTAASAANTAAETASNLPKIQNGTFWLYDAQKKAYVDSGKPATGRSPKIEDGTWWVWSDDLQQYTNTGISVNSSYELTKQKVENVLTGDVTTHNHATELAQVLANYVKKVSGKGLSTNDFTNTLKQKLEGLTNYDDAAVQQSIQDISTRLDTLIGKSASEAIDNFKEIEKFLLGITDKESLTGLLESVKLEIEALIPTNLSQLKSDTTHQLVTSEEKQRWEGKQEAGDYALKSELPSTEGLATKLELAEKADKVDIVDHGTGDTTFAITPNKLHKWGKVASLTLTLATPSDATKVNEYMVEFQSGKQAATLGLPSAIKWIGGKAPKIAANKTYQLSIINNIAAIGEA